MKIPSKNCRFAQIHNPLNLTVSSQSPNEFAQIKQNKARNDDIRNYNVIGKPSVMD